MNLFFPELNNIFSCNENNYLIDPNEVINGENVLIYCLKKNIYLSDEKLDFLIKNTNLNFYTKFKNSTAHYLLQYNFQKKINLNEEQLIFLMKHSNLNAIDSSGWTTSMHLLRQNIKKPTYINNNSFYFILENTDLKYLTKQKNNFIYFLMYNNFFDIKITDQELIFILKKIDINIVNDDNLKCLDLFLEKGLFLQFPNSLNYLIDNYDYKNLKKHPFLNLLKNYPNKNISYNLLLDIYYEFSKKENFLNIFSKFDRQICEDFSWKKLFNKLNKDLVIKEKQFLEKNIANIDIKTKPIFKV